METPAVKPCRAQQPCQRSPLYLTGELAQSEPMLRVLVHRYQEKYEAGDLENAGWMAQMLVANAETSSARPFILLSRLLLADVWRAQGRLDSARTMFQTLRATSSEYADFAEYHQMALFGLGRTAFEQGDIALLEECIREHGMVNYGCSCSSVYRIQFLQGLHDIEQRQLGLAHKRFRSLADEIGTTYDRLVARLGIAEVAALQREVTSAVQEMQQIDWAAEYKHAAGVFVNNRLTFPNAIQIAKDRGLAAWRIQQPNVDQISTSRLTDRDPALYVELFGPGDAKVDHRPLNMSNRMERILLAYLAFNPDGVDINSLRDNIWPEAIDDDSIKKAMWRLGERLKYNRDGETVYHLTYKDGIFKLDEFRSDVAVYNHLWERARALPLQDRFATLRAMCTIYTSPFLNGTRNHQWVDERRGFLQQRQGWVFWQLGGVYFRDPHGPQPQESIHYLDLALQADPFFDNAMNDYMRVMEYMGQKTGALERYGLYKKRVEQAYGCLPDLRLRQLEEKIKGISQEPITTAFGSGALKRAGLYSRVTMPQLTSGEEAQA